VQARLAKNKKAPARHKAEDDYILTTKLFCGLCGAFMYGESGRGSLNKVYHYYKCSTAKKHHRNPCLAEGVNIPVDCPAVDFKPLGQIWSGNTIIL